MKKPFLCKIGIHKWKEYQGKEIYWTLYRKCEKCGKIQELSPDSWGGTWGKPHWERKSYEDLPVADFVPKKEDKK